MLKYLNFKVDCAKVNHAPGSFSIFILDYLPNEQYHNVIENSNDDYMSTPTNRALNREGKCKSKFSKTASEPKYTPSLSSAVSTISTITLTENNNIKSDVSEDLNEVRKFPPTKRAFNRFAY